MKVTHVLCALSDHTAHHAVPQAIVGAGAQLLRLDWSVATAGFGEVEAILFRPAARIKAEKKR